MQIVLNEAVSKVKPIKYVSTPTAKTETRLGVAGYPDDLDNGSFMYQEWISGIIDLAHTNQLLSYEIDTFGGRLLSHSARGSNTLTLVTPRPVRLTCSDERCVHCRYAPTSVEVHTIR